MTRTLRRSLIAVIALAAVLALLPAPAMAGRVVYVRGFYGPGWGWGPAWGPGWWGPGYHYVPNAGTVKLHTDAMEKQASVYVDGGYAGIAAKMKKFELRPGTHELALRTPGGATIYDERIEVLRGRTTDIYVRG